MSSSSSSSSSLSSSSPPSPHFPLSLSFGVFGLQGVRPTMEDEIHAEDNFFKAGQRDDKKDKENEESIEQEKPLEGEDFSIFCVFDGHGGVGAARFAKRRLPEEIHKNLTNQMEISKALHKAFLDTDDAFREFVKNGKSAPSEVGDTSGTTAVVGILAKKRGKLWVANCGDSRGIVINSMGKSIALTRDHKADRPDEIERIRKAGGFVVHKRVMGELAISRAIGDLDFKEKGFTFVIADPEIECIQLTPSSHVSLLFGCDGLFDVMSNDEAANFIFSEFLGGKSPAVIVEKIVRHAVENLNTRDNVSAIVVKLIFDGHTETLNKLSHKAIPFTSNSSPMPIRKISSAEDIKSVAFHTENSPRPEDDDAESAEIPVVIERESERESLPIKFDISLTEDSLDEELEEKDVEIVGSE